MEERKVFKAEEELELINKSSLYEELLKKACEVEGNYPLAEAFCKKYNATITVKSLMLMHRDDIELPVREYNAIARAGVDKIYKLFKLVECPERCTLEELQKKKKYEDMLQKAYDKLKDKIDRRVLIKLEAKRKKEDATEIISRRAWGIFEYDSLMELMDEVLRDLL